MSSSDELEPPEFDELDEPELPELPEPLDELPELLEPPPDEPELLELPELLEPLDEPELPELLELLELLEPLELLDEPDELDLFELPEPVERDGAAVARLELSDGAFVLFGADVAAVFAFASLLSLLPELFSRSLTRSLSVSFSVSRVCIVSFISSVSEEKSLFPIKVHAPIKDTQNTTSAQSITPSTRPIFFPIEPFFFVFTGFVDIDVEPFVERIYETPFNKACIPKKFSRYPVMRFPSAPRFNIPVSTSIIMIPDTIIPQKIAGKAYLKRISSSAAIIEPVHAPVVGSGMATNRKIPIALAFISPSAFFLALVSSQCFFKPFHNGAKQQKNERNHQKVTENRQGVTPNHV